jgi:hypothetical protein
VPLGITLVLALVLGVAAWGASELVQGVFDPTLTLGRSMSGEMDRLMYQARAHTSAAIYGLLGGGVGLALGLAGGWSRGPGRSRWSLAALGLVAGAAAGALLPLVLVPIHSRQYDPDTEDLIFPMLIHGGMWGAVGLAAGFVHGLARGGIQPAIKAALGGLLGAGLAAAAYEVIGAVAFPLDQTANPFAKQWMPRLLSFVLVALLVAIGAATGLQERRARKPAASSSSAPVG